MQLFRTEVTGPVKDDKLTPRITQTAKAIWLIYVAMAILCALAYKWAGMSWFDAIGHSFGTVSTGGFSTHDESIGYFTNPQVKLVAIVFMLLGAVSFNLHFLALKRQKLKLYIDDPELRFFIKLIVCVVMIIWVALIFFPHHKATPHSAMDTLFEAVSFATTSGYGAVDFSLWPTFIPMMLLFCGLIGGCAGSTSGGVKAVRALLLQKQGTREIRRLIHPHGQYVVKLGNTPLSARVIEAIWGFFAIYFVTFTVLLLLILIFEQDFFTSYTALIAAISNSGRGLGDVAINFSSLSSQGKWILSFAMLAGRLEIFTILVLFSPAFWRR